MQAIKIIRFGGLFLTLALILAFAVGASVIEPASPTPTPTPVPVVLPEDDNGLNSLSASGNAASGPSGVKIIPQEELDSLIQQNREETLASQNSLLPMPAAANAYWQSCVSGPYGYVGQSDWWTCGVASV